MYVFRNYGKLPNVHIVLFMGMLAFAISHGFSSWLSNILEIKGFTPQKAGFAASITVAAGPLLMRVLMDLSGTFMAGTLFLAGLCMAIAVFTRFLNHHPESY